MSRVSFFRACSHFWRIRLSVSLAWLGICLAGDAYAQIFVVNQESGTIGKYTLSGTVINAALISGLAAPTGIAVAGDYLYVAQENGTVRKYTTSGALVSPALITGLNLPWGLAVSGDYLYVANGGAPDSTVGKYSANSGAVVNASLISGLDNPTGLIVSGNDLYVSEWSTGIIGKYTTSGQTVTESLIPAQFESPLSYPGGLALDDSGYLYVSTVEDGVRKYTTSGALVNPLLIPNAYNSGVGLVYFGNGQLLVANNFGGPGGNIIGLYTTAGAVVDPDFITGLHNPVAIAVLVPEPGSAFLASLGLGCLLCRFASNRTGR